jgi:hypothetical protein
MRGLVLVLAACGAQRSPEVPHNNAPSPATVTCSRDGTARLTILTGALPAGCSGGEFTIDGVPLGKYPVSCAQVPAGLHTVGILSANDCAGYLTCKLDLATGRETVLDLRNPACAR